MVGHVRRIEAAAPISASTVPTTMGALRFHLSKAEMALCGTENAMAAGHKAPKGKGKGLAKISAFAASTCLVLHPFPCFSFSLFHRIQKATLDGESEATAAQSSAPFRSSAPSFARKLKK